MRLGLVSNSSSSSFVVKKSVLTREQVDALRDHIDHYLDKIATSPDEGMRENRDSYEWTISETDTCIVGSTCMDNFNMYDFMEKIGIDVKRDVEFSS